LRQQDRRFADRNQGRSEHRQSQPGSGQQLAHRRDQLQRCGPAGRSDATRRPQATGRTNRQPGAEGQEGQ
nr:hypothetical protein [Tanacetum cinerariifolium]